MGNNDCDEGSAQKPAQPSEFHPQAEATPGYWGGGGAQGFPSPELVLTARCQGEIPTDALSVRAMGVQPTQSQRTVVSAANIDSINLGSHKMITFSFAMAYQCHDVVFNNSIPRQSAQVTVESHIDREPAKKQKLSLFRKKS